MNIKLTITGLGALLVALGSVLGWAETEYFGSAWWPGSVEETLLDIASFCITTAGWVSMIEVKRKVSV